jgi:phage baseplate assembly protein W
MVNNRLLLSNWAIDVDKNGISNGEIKDIDVINQSIELIITTNFGERLFNLSFGSNLTNKLFENMTPSLADSILNDITAAVKRWEDRITVDESQMRIIQNNSDNSIIILIPYSINTSGVSSMFKKKIVNF